MTARIDAAGNVIGRYEADRPGAPALMLGSHLDTVRNAGRYDGILGVLTAVSCVGEVARIGARLPFALEVAAFNDEEGVRFGTSVLGSRALAGQCTSDVMSRHDAGGLSAWEAVAAFGVDPAQIAAAARRAEDLLAYVELHIEQGPVLERRGLALGCVTSIAAACRMDVTIHGCAGHAGTVPVAARRDALTTASACILAVEAVSRTGDMVGTVGEVTVNPGASNVIPGQVRFSVDLRAGKDADLATGMERLKAEFDEIAVARDVVLAVEPLSRRDALPCAPWLMEQIEAAIATVQLDVARLPSGAGHDGLSMVGLTEVGMMFVRCTGGLSHHPDEAMTHGDVETAAAALLHFITRFTPVGGPLHPQHTGDQT